MLHLPHLITDLGLILGAAAIITIIFKWLKQPLVLGYLIAGFLVGPHFTVFPTVAEVENISVWAEIGVIILLFSLGLEFSFKKLLKVGTPASVTAIVEVMFMLMIGYVAGSLMGWSKMDSIFLGGVLSISSTTIIIRAFEELGVKGHKFAGLVFGILIVEDLVAIVLMVLLSTLAVSSQFAGTDMLMSVAKLVFFLVLWFISGIFFLPTFLRKAKKFMNDEMLLITSLALCILMVWLATIVGFSPALGAFIMGSILAETVYAEKIEHLIKPVKDLFGSVFFVSVGMMFDPQMLAKYALPVVLIIVVTIIGKALSTTAGALISGQPLKSSVQAGMSLSQIGEFSFIIATLGLTLKVTSDFLYPIAVAVSAITTFTTPYMIRISEPLYEWLQRKLPASWTSAIHRYSSRSQTISSSTDWQVYVRSGMVNTVLVSVITTAIVMLSSHYLLPYTRTRLGDNTWTTVIGAVCTLAFMAPFLWSLAVKQHRKDLVEKFVSQNKYRTGMLLLQLFRTAIAIFLIGFLLDRFFSPQIAFIVTVVMLLLLIIFSKRIQFLYSRIRTRFLANYNEREEQKAKKDMLAPWDAHIAEFVLSPDMPGVGKTLKELAWREKYGLNVAIIERGNMIINTPKRDQRIFPGDALFMIGTDDQLDQFKADMEAGKSLVAEKKPIEVVLEHFNVTDDSVFANKNIREGEIREKIHGIVVGIENENGRIVNPDSSYVIRPGDTVWVVGDKLRLLSLQKSKQLV
ncbi:MAG: sodium:proton antiporter [Chitinophagaceae bacterium]|jgi:CPA2 family monovalent cation:H+ antiporter-2|nr:cation:proton antiporter [Sphingobacteriales bacterium]OJW02898.1 MAG: sodium:proton antiporter [Sphingobacteriales bacterium 44-61]TXJ27916.1 MAG: sodium:proton antiporter [Chitinophagaceae bacterium]